MSKLLVVLITSVLWAQQPESGTAPPAPTPANASSPTAEPSEDLLALAKRVDTAHHPKGQNTPVTAFRGNFELHLLDATAEQRGQVDLAVQFLEWTQPGKTKARPLLRYEVQEAGKPIVRGRDRFGPWQLSQGKPEDLTGDLQRDLDECDRHTNLARQLLRFLAPADVLRSLQRASAVRDEPLNVERGVRIDCSTVEGDLAAFPLLQQGGEDAPVHVKVYVTKAEGHLLAIDAWPRADDTIDPARGERILLLDLHERDGLLVPRELKHLFRGTDGRLHLKSRAVLKTLSLRPELGVDDFDRTRK